jgi:hypothetical protein
MEVEITCLSVVYLTTLSSSSDVVLNDRMVNE